MTMGGTGGRRFGPGEDFNEESLYLDCSRCSRVHCCPNPCTTAHRQVHETRLRKHATILRREPQRREDGNRLFNCRKAVLSKQWAHLGRDEPGRQDMDMRFLVTRSPLLFMHNLLSDSARVTHAFCWLADTTLASLQGLISESLKPKKYPVMGFASDHREYGSPLAETGREPLGSSSRNFAPRIRRPRPPGRCPHGVIARRNRWISKVF